MLAPNLATLLVVAVATTPLARAATPAPPSQLFATDSYTKILVTANSQDPPTTYPEYTAADGSWSLFPSSDWTSAFFPSLLYRLHERHTVLCPSTTPTADNGSTTDWLSLARSWGEGLYAPDASQLSEWTHDVGFLSWPAQTELEMNSGNTTARSTVLEEAEALAARFSSVVGCTRSWDRGEDNFEVIIDNMVNLQLFVKAYELTGNTTYLDMATSHANKTIEHQVREDGSTFHVVDYSPTTGDVLWQGTAQGYSNSSTWSRGQAWATLGFALMHNSTGIDLYLDTAKRAANYYLSHLPASGVAYWDFDAPLPASLDTSASLIFSSALLLLSTLDNNATWADSAVTLLSNIVDQGVTDWEGASLVGNGTVNNRANPPNNNTGIIYGDYYFVETGNQLLKLSLANCSDGTPAVGSPSSSHSVVSSPGKTSTTPSSTSLSASSTPTSAASRSRAPPLFSWAFGHF